MSERNRLRPWVPRVLAALVAAACLSFAADSRAQAQVSDQFTHVTRELAKRFVMAELEGVCESLSREPSLRAVCQQVVSSIGDIFGMVVDGNVDADRVAALLRNELAKVVQAVANDMGEQVIKTLLPTVSTPTGPCSAAGLAEPVATCLVARAYQRKPGSPAACAEADRALRAALTRCAVHDDLGHLDTIALIRRLSDALQADADAHPDAYGPVVVLAQLAKVSERSEGASFYAIAREVAESQATMMQTLETPGRHAVFDDDYANTMVNAQGACAGRDEVIRRARAWEATRDETFYAIARALARMRPLPPDAANLPDDLPDPRCTSADAPLAMVAQTLRNRARKFRIDAMLVEQTQKFVLPAMLVAILVDYVRTGDDAMLSSSLRDFALQGLARAIADAEAEDEVVCVRKASGNGLSCQPRSGGPAFTANADGVPDEDLTFFLASRHSPRSARRTCAYQAVSAALEGTFPTFPGTGTICRRTDDPALDTLFGDGALLHDYLTAVDEGAHLYKWNPAEVKSSIAPGTASLHFASTLPANAGVQMLEILFPMLRKAIGAGNDSDTMLLQVAVLGLKAGTGGRRDLLRAASDALRPSLATFLNRLIPGSSACAQSASASSLPCGVRVLVDAAYEPIMAYVSEPSPGNAERKELTQQILERLDALDPLGRSPLLFDVGPGATMLTGLGKKSLTYHFTLVDKYGLALRWGDRREWQLGIFVGGFVDALVQKLSGTNDVVSYWLSGGTFGVRQFSKDFPVGLEMYAASANPFDLGRFKDNIGFATGLNALVPIDMLFNSSK